MIDFAISLHIHSERRGCPVSGDDRIGSMFPQVHSVLLHFCHAHKAAGKRCGGLSGNLGKSHLDFKMAHQFWMRISGRNRMGSIQHDLLCNVAFENEWLCSEVNWHVKREGLYCPAALPEVLCMKTGQVSGLQIWMESRFLGVLGKGIHLCVL